MSTFISSHFPHVKVDKDLFYKSLADLIKSQNTSYGTHSADNFVTFGRNLSFFWNENFKNSYTIHALGESGNESDKVTVWRKAVHYWAGHHAMNIDGDFVECGVWKGTTVNIIYDALEFNKSIKKYWLYDIFNHSENDLHHNLEGLDDSLYENVKSRFKSKLNVNIIQGYIPESFIKGVPDKIALLHIDMNNAKAEIAALDELWDKVTPGGIVLLDDFGWVAYQSQTIAELEFFKIRGYSVLEIPTGQGLVIKR
jgi:O-methyltransferase